MTSTARLLASLLCTMSAAGLAAQETAPPPAPLQGPTFRTGVDLVTLDVTVVDGRGRPVEDLLAADFSVRVNGEPRRVVSAQLVTVDIEAARKQVEDRSETFYTSNLTAPNGRQIVIAVDQTNIRAGALRPVLDAASRFLDRLSPLDEVAFVTYPEPGPRVNFTTDKLRLRLAMQGLIGLQNDVPTGRYNIGATEAVAIEERGDQVRFAEAISRECASASQGQQRAQCERDVLDQSRRLASQIRLEAEQSLFGLRRLLEQLTLVDGPKALILLSESLAVSERSDLERVVQLAAAARTSINVLALDLRRGDITIAERPPTEFEDRRLSMQGLEMLASMSRGALFHVTGTAESLFERLASEISAHYVLGIEERPGDGQGGGHRVDVEVRRRDVTIRSRQALVLSSGPSVRRPPRETLEAALRSPFAVSGLPLRVTTFAHQDAASDRVRLLIAAQIGQPGAPPAPMTVGYVVLDSLNQVAASFVDEMTLSPASDGPNEPLAFLRGVMLGPGVYSLRFAVVDAEGRRGSIVREVNAWKMAGEAFALGDLVVGRVPEQGQGISVQVEPRVTNEVAAYVELYSTSAETWTGTAVALEIAADQDSPSLAKVEAPPSPGTQPGWRVASGIVDARALPPGRYVARATVERDGKMVGVLARPFVLEPGEQARATPAVVVPSAALIVSSVPRFDAAVLDTLLGSMLDMVERRSPNLKAAMAEARAGRFGPAALEALGAGDQEAAAFLRGVDLFAKGQLDRAAVQLQIAAGPRREFFPAALYLGATFAAAGRDRDAAGVWQLALGSQPRAAAVHIMAAEARLRAEQPDAAVDILKPAYERDPADDEVARRLAMALVVAGRFAEAVPVLDAHLARRGDDQELLYAAVAANYELVRAGRVLSNEERAKLRGYVAAYRGPQRALAEKYLDTISPRP